MLDQKDFYDNINEWHKQSKADVRDNFADLTSYISKLCPIKLLLQLSLTFLFVPEGEFREESDEVHVWARWIEFLSGYLLSRNYPVGPEKNIDGEDIGKIEKLLENYFNSISGCLISSVSNKDEDLDARMLVSSIRLYSLYVRGPTYSHKFLELARNLYSEHDQWFTRKLGFTISQAIDISTSIIEEYNERINLSRQNTKELARKTVDKWIGTGEVQKTDRDEIELRFACYLHFGNADELLSFTVDDLSSFSGFEKDICQRYLDRLSQNFGYRNTEFPETFEDPYLAPWDYNTLYEKPIVCWSGKYFVPIASLFPEVLFNTFHYDLLTDSSYKAEYDKKRATWLERRTADCFKAIFPKDAVLLNPKYPNGEELADVLVLHDRKIFIVQCKSKKMRHESRIGDNFKALKNDVNKGIREAFDQALRARDYLEKNTDAHIIIGKRSLGIDMNQVSDIFLISITLSDYQNLTTRFANIEPALGLFGDNQYPWALSLPDLEVLAEIIDFPSMFIHYAKQRLQVEQTNLRLTADEMDLLGFYLEQGLSLENDFFKNLDGVSLSGFSTEIDRYMHCKYFLDESISKPKFNMPSGFENYLSDIERLELSYKTDCAIRLLDLSYQGKELVVNAAEQIKGKTRRDGGLHSFSTVVKSNKFGISFVAMDAKGDNNKLFYQIANFGIMKKHKMKCKEWISLGWDKNSERKVDVVAFSSFEPFDDPVLDKMANEHMRDGDFIEAEKIIKKEK